MPAFAPVDRAVDPDPLAGLGLGLVFVVVVVAVTEGLVVGVGVVGVEVGAGKRLWSDGLYATVMGCAHIDMGPVTVSHVRP